MTKVEPQRRARIVVLALAAAVATTGAIAASSACSYDWTFTPDGGTPSPATSDGSSNPPIDAPETPAKPLPPSPCKTSTDCEPTAYCRFADEQCGRASADGTCVAIDDACREPTPPVAGCACDGLPAATVCDAAKARRVDVDRSPSCKEGLFECPNAPGPCKRKLEYCRASRTVGGGKCVELGSCAVDPKCTACPEFESGGCTCNDDDPTAIVLTCP